MINEIKEQYLKKYYQQYIRKDYRPLHKGTNKPVEPWAFIRVKNEMITMPKSLESILPVIKKGVIGYNDCTDGSKQFIEEFCKRNVGFIPYEYPHEVYPPCSPKYFDNPKEENRLDTYYNQVLKFIPNDTWMLKIDMDHIYDPVKLGRFLRLPRSQQECFVVANLNLHVENGQVFVRKDHPFTAGDMILQFRDSSFKFIMDQYLVDDGYYACETMVRDNRQVKRIYTDLFNYHFPYIKKYRTVDSGNLLPFDDFIKDILPTMRYGFLIPKEMLDKERILSIYRGFNL